MLGPQNGSKRIQINKNRFCIPFLKAFEDKNKSWCDFVTILEVFGYAKMRKSVGRNDGTTRVEKLKSIF